jgi:competence ComEA-like helix-hairpin-helix protein
MLWKEYFSFTKGQRNAIIFLIVVLTFLSFIYFLMPQFVHNPIANKNNEIDSMIALIHFDSTSNDSDNKQQTLPAKLTPFNFNPNTLDEAGFRKLGLRDKLIGTILNYRNKGGKFYNAESLKRIYGLHEDEFAQLEPYISIPNNYSNSFEQKPKEIISVELNTADTSQLVKLKGIGSKLSMNIIKYREQLGGFANVNQLKEVYGISLETFDKIKGNCTVNISKIKKINLNEATYGELNAHPLLRGEIAKAIADFRKAKNYHIDQISQLKEIELINDEKFRKIAPYLSIQ